MSRINTIDICTSSFLDYKKLNRNSLENHKSKYQQTKILQFKNVSVSAVRHCKILLLFLCDDDYTRQPHLFGTSRSQKS